FVSTGPVSRVSGSLHNEPQFGFYHLLLRAWSALGTSEFALRSLSTVFAVLTLPALYCVGRRLFDGRIAATAVVLLAVNGYFVGWAREVRMYSLLAFASTVATLCLLRAIEQPDRWVRWAAWVMM